MKNLIVLSVASCISFLSATSNLKAQIKELKFNFNEEGSHYVKTTFLGQVWARYTENNPGTTIDGNAEDATFDIGIRRVRIQLFGQLSDRVFFYSQFGNNNLSYNGARKQGLFFHDVLGELKIADEYISVGAGLTGWSGLSRYASPSVGTILSLDAPIYQQATNDVNDQFLRKYSIYAKGKFGVLDYRVALSKPMLVSQSAAQTTSISDNALFSPEPPDLQYQGYFMFQFQEKESNLTPYTVGTYLGTKNVFNIGAGAVYQNNAMWYSENNGTDTVHHHLLLVAADVFCDHILNSAKRTALTGYASFSLNDYGKNYVRNVGVMNPANGTNNSGSFSGAGNAFPMAGTGTTTYAQLGYLFRHDLLGKIGTLQPYAAIQYSVFELLKDPMIMYEGGFNWLIDGHNSKISFNYQSRPVFAPNQNSDLVEIGRKGMMVLQLQVAI